MRDAMRLHQAGRLEDAGAIYARVLAADPHHVDALHLSGLVAYKQGRFDEAIALVTRAAARAPGNAVLAYNLGNILKDAGRRDDAIASYRRAIAHDAAHVPARNNLGVLLLEAGDSVAAVDAFRAVIARDASHARAHANLGKALIAVGDTAAAEAALCRAIELDPRMGEAHGDLGLLLQRQRRLDEAVAVFERRTAIDTASSIAQADLALALQQAGDHARAAGAYAAAESLAPMTLEATSNACALLQKICAWERLAALAPRVLHALSTGAPGIAAGLAVSLHGVTPAMQLAAARNHARPFAGRTPLTSRRAIDGDTRKLRIGYLSADFRAHATTHLVGEVVELHDRDRHDVILFSYGPDDGSAERARVAAAADAFVDIAALDDREAALRIAAMDVDLLVDLNGATDNGRMGIASWRPAPWQVNWLGFPGTLGAAFYDAMIADACVVPPAEERHYAEIVVRLPGCYQPNDRQRPRPMDSLTREAAGLPRDAVVLCCFNQSYKITPEVFAVWMRVLASAPDAVLWLYDDNPLATASLRERAAAAGVDPARLVFAARAPLAAHLARYAVADFAVDTFPCTSHTTASDALWMGCPLVTLTGATFAARVAPSIVVHARMPDLAADSLPAYEALAGGLARDASRRADVRRRAGLAWAQSALFDTPRFVRHLEAAYRALTRTPPPADP